MDAIFAHTSKSKLPLTLTVITITNIQIGKLLPTSYGYAYVHPTDDTN